MKSDDTFLTPKKLSERYCGISLTTIANWRNGHGKAGGPPFIKAGGRVLYPMSLLLIWEAASLQESGANLRTPAAILKNAGVIPPPPESTDDGGPSVDEPAEE